jgi:hypothetical protein
MPKTYEPISTTTLGSAAASVTFSSITGTYTDLVIVTSAKLTTGSNDAIVRFNGDTGNNYSSTILSGNGTSASSVRVSNNDKMYLDSAGWVTSGEFNVSIGHFMNYSNTTTYKTMLARGNNATSGVDAIVNLWSSTAAITSIQVLAATSTFTAGSTFTLYGIKSF